MATRIWKTQIDVRRRIEVKVPAGSKWLSVQPQYDDVSLWFECDPAAPLETRTLSLYGTGSDIVGDPGDYIGTFQIEDGNYVFHLYEPRI